MRVTIVSRIYRPEPAAASFFLGSVADALTAAGASVTVLTAALPKHLRSGGGRRAASSGQRGAGRGAWAGSETVKTFPVLRDRQGYVKGYLQYLSFDVPLFLRLLLGKKPDVVFMEPPPTTGLTVRVVCALRRIPYVYDAADIWSDAAGVAGAPSFVVRVVRGMERFALRGAARLVTISAGVVTRLRQLGVQTPATVIGFGAQTEEFRYQEPTATAAGQPRFIYAGTYAELHGAELVLEAFARLRQRHPGCRLSFFGNGDEQAFREHASRLGIADAVSFSPAISPAQLRYELANSVAAVATLKPGSGYEYAFTSKIYSALATGCPVVFAGPGPTADFIHEAAAARPLGLATAYSAADLASAMEQLLTSPLPAAARRELAAWTAAEHSMSAVAARAAAEITAAANRSPARQRQQQRQDRQPRSSKQRQQRWEPRV